MSDDFVTLNEARYLLEHARINKLYGGLDPWEIRDLTRQFCERLVSNMTLEEIVGMGETSIYGRMFHIELEDIEENTKKYEEDVVLDFKHDHEISDEV